LKAGGDYLRVSLPQPDGIDDEDALRGPALAEMHRRLTLLESQGERKGRYADGGLVHADLEQRISAGLGGRQESCPDVGASARRS
jgi:hypothetical protein